MQRLWLLGNQFIDLPDLSAIPNLVEMKIERNKFTFEDIERNIDVAAIFTYSPQDSLGLERDTTINEGDPLELWVSVGGEHNIYQWFRNGLPISGVTDSMLTIHEIVPADSGIYTCEISNSIATRLKLYTRPIHVKVKEKVAIYLSCDSPQIAGSDFWVEVKIGTESRPVANLFGSSFVLHYDSSYVDVVKPYSDHVVPGEFLGDTSRVVFYSPELPGDSVNVGISRKSGDRNVSGYGTIVKIKFRASRNTPDGTLVHFYLTAVTARDSAWNYIPLSLKELNLTIVQPLVVVWPGDTNNDGIVNQADVLPIGLAMGYKGPRRLNATLKWIGQRCTSWIPERATYVDVTGNGIVETLDLVGIKLNWGKSNSMEKTSLFTQFYEQDSIAHIFPACDTFQPAAAEFWLDINVGTESLPVTDLFGVAFVLKFDDTFAEIAPPRSEHVIPGDFLGDSSEVVFFSPDVPGDSINIGISRQGTGVDVSGFGTVARAKFLTRADTPDSTRIHFWIESVIASDADWNTVALAPRDLWVTILRDRLAVYPGDTNNDGVVNQVDVLPLGLGWNLLGPRRVNAAMTWSAQTCLSWNPARATYADANGDGVVNESDLLPIGLNWGRTHGANGQKFLAKTTGFQGTIRPIIQDTDRSENDLLVQIEVQGVKDLFGIAFDLTYQIDKVEIVSLQPGTCWTSDRLFYQQNDKSTGKLALAISQKSGKPGLNDNHYIAQLKVRGKTANLIGQDLVFELNDIVANHSSGEIFVLATENSTAINSSSELPAEFRLDQNYPNPFNAETRISYSLAADSRVQIAVYNLLGQKLRTLVDSKQRAGWHSIGWNGRNISGESMPSGIYLIRMKAGHFTAIRKMILTR